MGGSPLFLQTTITTTCLTTAAAQSNSRYSRSKLVLLVTTHTSFLLQFQLPACSSIRTTTTTQLFPSSSFSTATAALKSPKGFGPPAKKTPPKKKSSSSNEEELEEEELEEEEEDVAIPEVVTNRMMTRVGLSVGIPLTVGILFFPLFYYLKKVANIDVPNWIPFIVSFIFFGTALLGVTYGIVSASWDPLRQGSLIGWNEARRNWPVFWDSIRGRPRGNANGTRRGN